MGKRWKQLQTLFWGVPNSLLTVTAAIKLKDAGGCYSHEIKKKKRNKKKKLGRKAMGKLHSISKSKDIILPTKSV